MSEQKSATLKANDKKAAIGISNVTSNCRFLDAKRRTVIPVSALDGAGIPLCSVIDWSVHNGCLVGSPVVGTTTMDVKTGKTVRKGR
ncbi:MAG: hypothetical protein VB092_07410 [Oscillospiraceae bacterium]|nr:hypothetical protein [Oscillospiraceae bacterium]